MSKTVTPGTNNHLEKVVHALTRKVLSLEEEITEIREGKMAREGVIQFGQSQEIKEKKIM